jgi:large subunit ribosomal protein L15
MTTLNNTTQVKIKKMRVGRGIGSGKGKTSGRGMKGQKSRSGVAIKSFEGGQMPLFRRLPKRGFNPIKKEKIAIINLGKIQSLLDAKRINSETKIDLDLLKKANIISKNYKKIKILGSGEIKDKIDVNVDFFSKSAEEKLKKIGGSITLKKKI